MEKHTTTPSTKMKVTEGKKIRKLWREKDGKWKRNQSKEVSVVAFCATKPLQLLGLLQKQAEKLEVPSICWLLRMRLCFIFIMIAPTNFSEYKVLLLRCNTYNKKHPQVSFSYPYPTQKEKKSYGRTLAQGNEKNPTGQVCSWKQSPIFPKYTLIHSITQEAFKISN